jgi:hypothetical protein
MLQGSLSVFIEEAALSIETVNPKTYKLPYLNGVRPKQDLISSKT